MDEKEPHYVVCRNGVFLLPEAIVRSLTAHTRGPVYCREDHDVLTISTSQIVDGWKRPLSARFRATMFRDATKLAIVDLHDSIRVMGVEWRTRTLLVT